MDARKNFARGFLNAGIAAGATSLTLQSGQGSRFPDPAAGNYNLVLFNFSDYPNAAEDPNVEIVRATAKTGDVFTITRAQEGTSDVNHNTGGKTYKVMMALTAKMLDDINADDLAKILKSIGTTKGDLIVFTGSATPVRQEIGFDGDVLVVDSAQTNGLKWAAPAGTPTGLIVPFAGAAANVPTGFLLCDGAAVSRSTYTALFALIGTTYGAGNGTTTFNVPDMKGRVPVGYDAGQTEFNAVAKTGGEKTHQLTTTEMPSHSHSVELSPIAGATKTYSASTNNNDVGSKQTGSAGGNGAHNNLQPYIALHYVIKT